MSYANIFQKKYKWPRSYSIWRQYLETAFRILTGESTLGKALISLEAAGIKIDEQLKNGYEKFMPLPVANKV